MTDTTTTTGTAVDSAAEEESLSGRRRVRALLLDPLEAAGLARRRGVTAEAHRAMCDRLAERLRHMEPEDLRGLFDLVVAQAVDGGRRWPEEAHVLHWAFRISPPPPDRHPYALSLIRSAMGRRAAVEGWAVELFEAALRFGPPPGRYIEAQLRADAEDAARRAARLREWEAVGRVNPEDAAWLARRRAIAARIAEIQQEAAAA